MNNNYTDLTLVIDRSGSMTSCREEAEEGLNNFIRNQAEQPGKGILTLVEFDDQYNIVHYGIPLKDVPYYKIKPRGWTALNDAIGKAINSTGSRLAAMPETERPGLVLFVIVTDGFENRSKIYRRKDIRAKIEHQRNKYNWQFTFIGADMDAIEIAETIGIDADSALSNNSKSYIGTYSVLDASVTRSRAFHGITGQSCAVSFSDEERVRASTTP